MGEQRGAKTAVLTDVNQRVLEAALDSPKSRTGSSSGECGAPDCHEHVNLTLTASFTMAAARYWLPGNRLSQLERAR
jgi:hypothetical protein